MQEQGGEGQVSGDDVVEDGALERNPDGRPELLLSRATGMRMTAKWQDTTNPKFTATTDSLCTSRWPKQAVLSCLKRGSSDLTPARTCMWVDERCRDAVLILRRRDPQQSITRQVSSAADTTSCPWPPPSTSTKAARQASASSLRTRRLCAQHRPRPGLEVWEVGIPAKRVRNKPAAPRPRGEAGGWQAKAEPGPDDRLAPVGLSLPRAQVAPAVAPGRYGGRLVDLLGVAPSVLGPRSRGGGLVVSPLQTK